MNSANGSIGGAPIAAPRLIGRAGSGEPSAPLLLVIAGLHGNEPAGVRAAGRVLAALAARSIAVRGEFIAVRGNVRALAEGKRFLQRDLNRGWTSAAVGAIRGATSSAAPGAEDLEQRELIAAIDKLAVAPHSRRVCIDLHTTSADGVPFVIIGDDREGRDLALQFGLPVVGGLFGSLQTVMMEYLWSAGFLAFAVEGGQNDLPASVDHHEAVLWLALLALDMVAEDVVPDLERHRQTLARARGELPHLMHVHHRHALGPDDQFRMEPGFTNLQRVRSGELLARDRNGEIRAPESGVLLMPLYQALGDDGFFLGSEDAS